MNLITESQLREWLNQLRANYTVIAPVQATSELVLYQPLGAADKVVLDAPRPVVSPKEFFLPATEAILTIERVRQATAGGEPVWDVQLTETQLPRDQVLFGVRPCDVHSLTVLDALLFDEPVDTYYAQRRERTTLVGMACAEMGPSCFCTGMGLSPDDARGMDIMLYPANETLRVSTEKTLRVSEDPKGLAATYILETLTDKGTTLVKGLKLDPYEGELPLKTWPPAEVKVAPRQVWTQSFDDPQWSELADRCLSCKVCAFVCPTCRCFDVRDQTVAQKPGYQKMERLRCWDACTTENYRRIAGGHNPRPAKSQRLRNRFYCKFDYYPADFGPMACVGCGRCIDLCPVNIDITEVLQQVAAKAETSEVRS